jgi:hypothetical protein
VGDKIMAINDLYSPRDLDTQLTEKRLAFGELYTQQLKGKPGKSPIENMAWLEIDPTYPSILREQFETKKLGFSFLPTEITLEGGDPNWSEVEVFGRFSPYQVYGGTASEGISFTLQFSAYLNAVADVRDKINWLRAMKFPLLYEGISYRPPALYLYWGSFFNGIRTILKSASPTYQAPWYIDADEKGYVDYQLYPMVAEVSVSLTVVSEVFVSGDDVMAGRSYI